MITIFLLLKSFFLILTRIILVILSTIGWGLAMILKVIASLFNRIFRRGEKNEIKD